MVPKPDFEKRAEPIARLEDPEFRAALKAADVIVGWDTHRRISSIFFGSAMLDLIASGEVGGQPLGIKVVAFDSRTDQLEMLIAAVQVLKGSHCYKGED